MISHWAKEDSEKLQYAPLFLNLNIDHLGIASNVDSSDLASADPLPGLVSQAERTLATCPRHPVAIEFIYGGRGGGGEDESSKDRGKLHIERCSRELVDGKVRLVRLDETVYG